MYCNPINASNFSRDNSKSDFRFLASLVVCACIVFNIELSINNFQHSLGIAAALCQKAGLTAGFTRTMLHGFVRTDLADSRGVQVSPFLENCTGVLRGDSSSSSDELLTSLGQYTVYLLHHWRCRKYLKQKVDHRKLSPHLIHIIRILFKHLLSFFSKIL